MKYVSEIFGFDSLYKDKSNIFRTKFLCPFKEKNGDCDPVNKKSNLTDDSGKLLLTHQTGACSCFYKSRESKKEIPVIICPTRFEEKNKNNEIIVFKKIKDYFFPDNKIYFKKEAGLGEYGQADFMIGIKENNKTIDIAHCEFQADATTGTRGIVECVKDFYSGANYIKNYSYGLNTKATIKGFSLQMIDKGFLFKKLKKISIWIMQDHLVGGFKKIYNLDLKVEGEKYKKNDENNIYIIEIVLIKNKNKYDLKVNKILSTSPEKIQSSLSNKPIISEKDLINIVESNNKKIAEF